MHWAPAHVNPMVALRTVVCNDHGAEAWPQAAAELRAGARRRWRQRREALGRTLRWQRRCPPRGTAPPVPARDPG